MRHDKPEQDTEDRGDGDDRDPPIGLLARGPARHEQADDRDAVAEPVDDDDHGDDEAESAADDETGREGHAVEEAVDAHPTRADDPDVSMGRVAMIELGGGLVADMDGRQLLDDVEREEAEGSREHDLVEGTVEQADGLRDEVEERRPDPDPGPDRDDHPDVADRAEGEESAEERRDECRGRDQEGRDRHQACPPADAWQAGHIPNSSSRCSSTRNPVWRATSRTTERRPASSISLVRPQLEQTTWWWWSGSQPT